MASVASWMDDVDELLARGDVDLARMAWNNLQSWFPDHDHIEPDWWAHMRLLFILHPREDEE